MKHVALSLSMAAAMVTLAINHLAAAEQPVDQLPRPHYQPQPGDPAWLATAVQFHGHLGPWAAGGLRAGMAGVRAVGAEGYFDVEVNVEGPLIKPPRSCFLDGLQVATGATLGKRNLHWTEADDLVVRVTNTRTGKTAEIRPTARLLKLLTSFQPKALAGVQDAEEQHEQEERVEQIARQIATAKQADLLVIEVTEGAKP